MSFNIRVNGLDKVLRNLEKIKKSLGFEDLNFWCKRISNDVKLKAPINKGERFLLEAELGENDKLKINISFLPELSELIIDIIRSYMIEMPEITRGLFAKIIEDIKNRKRGEKT